MTPDAVLHRYIEIAAWQPVQPDALAAFVCSDASLLARWCQLLAVPADAERLKVAMIALDAHSLSALAQLQAWTLSPAADTAPMSIERWQDELRLACLAEALAEYVDVAEPTDARVKTLLASAGVQLPLDPLLNDLSRYRGSDLELLEDAQILIRVFAVIERLAHEGETAAEAAAQSLLGIPTDDFADLVDRSANHALAIMSDLGLMDDLGADWRAKLRLEQQLLALGRFFSEWDGDSDPQACMTAHDFVARALLEERSMLLIVDDEQLCPVRTDDLAELKIDIASATSSIARLAKRGEPAEVATSERMSIADRQILDRLGSEDVRIYPMQRSGVLVGALLIGRDDDESHDEFVSAYAAMLSSRLPAPLAVADEANVEVDALHAYRDAESARLRELVHEANNPLSVVRNYLHILEMRLSREPEALAQVQLISEEIQRAAAIVAKAKDLTDPLTLAAQEDDTGDIEALLGPVDVAEVARRVAALQRHDAEQRDVVVALDLPRGPVFAHSDADMLTQILLNLLRNAIEAMADGGNASLSATGGVYRSGVQGVEVTVSDDASGLPAQVLDNLFQPKQSDKGGSHQGLGLHIVHRLVAELEGQIDVRTSDRGTSFTIFLPAATKVASS
ncbi:MAG: HAMP domain-containing histidine kinase [Pseudomonadaceae bacterium]|nr:HAMP domain-containing histidine kinase [Pseudomonadaceae bacterium]